MSKPSSSQSEIRLPEQTRTLTRRKWLKRSLFCLAAACSIDALLEPNFLSFETIQIPIHGLPDAFDGYRIALMADFHYPRTISAGYIQRAVAMANAFQPDLLALPGDFTDRKGSVTVPKLAGLFDHAQAKDGIVGTLGNHDHNLDAPGVRRELLAHTPIRLVENERILVERTGHVLAIGGVGDLHNGVVAPERAFAGLPADIPRILLSHNPDLAEEMRGDTRVDLQLSGHTHGGQACLNIGHIPSRYGNKFRSGLVQGRHHRVYVTRGVCSIARFRLFCPPEVTGIILRKA